MPRKKPKKPKKPKKGNDIMTQIARPVSDISTGSWTDEGIADNDGNLYTSVDETSQDSDTSYILDAAINSTCEVRLDTLTDPGDDTNHVMHVYFRTVGSGGPERLDVSLIQNTTVIETSSNNTNRSGTYADVNYTLTLASSITDYTNLRIRLTASNQGGGEQVRVTQVYLEIPDVPSADLSASASDSVTVGDTDTLSPLVLPDLIEAEDVTVVENVQAEIPIEITAIESITIGESDVESIGDLVVGESENVTIGDSASVSVAGAPVSDRDISEADAITVADTLPNVYYDNITVTDTATVEITVGVIDLDVSVSDSVTVSDAATFDPVSETNISASDTASVTDSASVTIPIAGQITISVSDSVTVADASSLVDSDPQISTSDIASIADNAAASVAEIGTITVSVSDSVTVIDAASLEDDDCYLIASGSVAVADATSIAIPSIDLSVGVADSVAVTGLAAVLFPDALMVTVGDSVTVTDSPAVDVPPLFTGIVDLTLLSRSVAFTLDSRDAPGLTIKTRSVAYTLDSRDAPALTIRTRSTAFTLKNEDGR